MATKFSPARFLEWLRQGYPKGVVPDMDIFAVTYVLKRELAEEDLAALVAEVKKQYEGQISREDLEFFIEHAALQTPTEKEIEAMRTRLKAAGIDVIDTQ